MNPIICTRIPLPDPALVPARVKQHAVELQPRPDLGLTVVDAHQVPFTHLVLPRPVFKDCVHDSFLTTLVWKR